MKLTLETEFLCSYYWHAALQAEKAIDGRALPESLYFAITALILWQCTLESYINFLIEKHGQQKYQFQRDNGKTVMLEKASIKEKWIYLPFAVCGKQFERNSEPFIGFSELVGLRNAVVHFDSDKLTFEKEAPDEVKTPSQVRAWINTNALAFFEGTFVERIFVLSSNGSRRVRGLIEQLHSMIGGATPAFLDGVKTVITFTIG